MRDLEVYGVEVTIDGGRVVLMLRDLASGQVLPIVVGAREGAAIASVQAGLVPPRPLTHDLMLTTISTLGSSVTEVDITKQSGGVFYAELVLATGERIDCRPSDGVALALRAGAAIRCSPELLRDAVPVEGLRESSGSAPSHDVGGAVIDDAVAELRKELEDLGPEDFGDERTEA